MEDGRGDLNPAVDDWCEWCVFMFIRVVGFGSFVAVGVGVGEFWISL